MTQTSPVTGTGAVSSLQAAPDGCPAARDRAGVVVKDAHDVGSCEDDAELEGELRGIGVRCQLALVSSRACLPAQQVTPLLLHPGHLVMDAPGPGSDLGGGGHEEAAPGEDPPLDVGEIPVAQRQQAIAACLRGQRGADDLADEALPGRVRSHDTERNVLCPANPWPTAAEDWIRTTLISQQAQVTWSTPDISGWLERSRVNAGRGIGDHATDPRMQASLHRLLISMKPALENLAHLAEISRPVAATART